MEAIIYLIQKNIINSLKELRKKPLKLITYIAMVLLIIISLVLSIKSNIKLTEGNIKVYKSIFLGLILMLLFLSLKVGIERGTNLFRLSDANFLFTAPIRSQLVLLYGFAKQMGSNLFLIVLLSFQMPNLYNNFPMKDYGWAIILLTTFLFAFLSSIMGVLIYSIASIKDEYKSIINYTLYGLSGLVLLGLIYNIINTGEPLQGAMNFFNMDLFNYIPIVGWLLNIYTSAILGFKLSTIVYIVLILLSVVTFLFIIYNLDLDYYEDALNNSLTKEEQLAKARSGRAGWSESKSKARKVKGSINYTKSKAILSKQILEVKKTGTLFIDKLTLFTSGFSLIFAYIVRDNGPNFLLYMLIYMNIILSQSNQWSMELDKHYIYLIPESSVKKILYATLLENIKALITGIITFGIATFIYDISLIEGIVLGITYGSFTSVILFSDLVIRRILGVGLSVIAERFIRFLIIAVVLIPGLILSYFLGLLINEYTAGQGIYLVLILYNMFISLLFITLSRGIFEKIDMR